MNLYSGQSSLPTLAIAHACFPLNHWVQLWFMPLLSSLRSKNLFWGGRHLHFHLWYEEQHALVQFDGACIHRELETVPSNSLKGMDVSRGSKVFSPLPERNPLSIKMSRQLLLKPYKLIPALSISGSFSVRDPYKSLFSQ